MANEETGTGPRIKSADRVLDLLETLSQTEEGMNFNELVARLEVPRSSLHGLLRRLVERQYVVYDNRSRLFSLGLQLFDLGQTFLRQYPESREARIVMESICMELRETVQFASLKDFETVNLANVESPHPLRVQSIIGKHFMAHATSLGKVLLAHLPREIAHARALQTGLPPFTRHTMTEASALMEELDRIRARGFSFDTEECIPGVFCIAVPITNAHGEIRTGMSVTIPTTRLDADLLVRALFLLADGACRINQKLGLRRPDERLESLRSLDAARSALVETQATQWVDLTA